jgi:hypothetical protein
MALHSPTLSLAMALWLQQESITEHLISKKLSKIASLSREDLESVLALPLNHIYSKDSMIQSFFFYFVNPVSLVTHPNKT